MVSLGLPCDDYYKENAVRGNVKEEAFTVAANVDGMLF